MSRKRALVSVADKAGIAAFARGLAKLGYEIVSSGGTAKHLENEGVPVKRVSEVTGAPEILGGRVKTLHPQIHGGILARRHLEGDLEELEAQGITPVDVVAVNFYPFQDAVEKRKPVGEILENIDIGGPSMLRAAAKNFEHVLAVVDPMDYPRVLEKLETGVDRAMRLELARKAFRMTERYERAIASFLDRLSASGEELRIEDEEAYPRDLALRFEKIQDLRYGENPHQTAAFYRDEGGSRSFGLGAAVQLQGKELSYNNILDLDAAWRLVRELPRDRAAAVVIKHTNPCGAALGGSGREAYLLAREVDPVSAFGGIVAMNVPVDAGAAEELASTFLEAVIAPAFEPRAIETLSAKKNLRLMTIDDPYPPAFRGFNLFRVLGGLLVQDWDSEDDASSQPVVVTERAPTTPETDAMRFAWTVAKHVKSNAIVFSREEVLLAVGAGQMSRVDSCRIAIQKARSSLEGSVAASDAFFPFRDGIDVLAEAGVAAIVQPGGSVRDEEVIAAANEHGMAMVFTGRRHFRH